MITSYIPDEKDFERVGNKLSRVTEDRAGLSYNPQTIAFVENKKDIVVGEVIGTYNLGRMNIDLLFVEDGERGEGIGARLVRKIEDFAKEKNLIGIDVWTFSWQGEGWWEEQDYEELVRVPTNRGKCQHPQYNIMYHKEL